MTTKIKVIAFDVLGTIINPAKALKDDIIKYVKHVNTWYMPEFYKPVDIPFYWRELDAFPDAKEGIELLARHYDIVTCSNWDVDSTNAVLEHNDISVDGIINLEERRTFKPQLCAYASICDYASRKPEEVLFVTGNKGGPDNTGAPEKIGMKTILIRHGWPNTIIELAGEMGC